MGNERETGVRELEPRSRAAKQPAAKIALKRLDGFAQTLLGDVELLCRMGKRAALGNLEKVCQGLRPHGTPLLKLANDDATARAYDDTASAWAMPATGRYNLWLWARNFFLFAFSYLTRG